MSSQNRKRIIIQAGKSSLIHPAVRIPGYEDIGMVSVGDDTGRLLRNSRSGTYVMHIGGTIQSLDQRKVLAALGQWANATKMEGGKRRNVYMSDADVDLAKRIGVGNLSEGIRIALNAYQQP